ncbi:MAG: DMT family transporter [Bacteroidetes bacterium]|nr:DMT family transporter [Bacteroidota bacterium]
MSKIKVHLILFLVMLFYAITFSIAKDVMPTYINGEVFTFYRIGGAMILFWMLSPFDQNVLPSKKLQKIERMDFIPLVIASVFGVAYNMFMFFKGLEYTNPINGAVLMLNTPIFVLIFALFLKEEKLSFKKVLGILMAAGGALMLMFGKEISFTDTTIKGDILVTVNAIFYAFYLVYVRKLLAKYTVVTVSKWTFLFGLFLVSPLILKDVLAVNNFSFPAYIIGEIIFVVFCTTFLAYLLNTWAIEKAGSVLVGTYIYLQPVLAGIIAILWGTDSLTWSKVIAGIIVFVGVFLTSDKQQELLRKSIEKSGK